MGPPAAGSGPDRRDGRAASAGVCEGKGPNVGLGSYARGDAIPLWRW
jgi:hypothetical protein